MSWGQYTELRPGEIYKGREKAGKTLKEMMKEKKKYILITHYSFHWSFVVIDNIKKKISTYDSGVQISGSHSKPNKALKISLESISGKQWNMEQVQVPQQNEGESCGYRMLSNLSKVIKGQEIQWEGDEERNRLYYYLEIAHPLKDNQIKEDRKEKEKGRRGRQRRNRRRTRATTPEKKQERQYRKQKKETHKPRKRGTRSGKGKERNKKTKQKQERREEEAERQGQEEEEQHTYSLRSSSYKSCRFRVENTQPD